MAEIFFYLLIIICIAIVGWSFIRLERVYQYPFFMVSMFLSFIAPQAYNLLTKAATESNARPNAADSLSKLFIYTCLCTAMCWLGYFKYKPSPKILSKLDICLDDKKLFQSGFLLLGIGYLCIFSLSKIKIETTAVGTWTGPATIIAFFSGVIFNAFPIFLIAALRKPTTPNICMAILSSLPILQVIAKGRRQPTMTFLLAIGMGFFLIKKYIPPRVFFIVAMVLAVVLIPLIGALRGEFWNLLFSGDWSQATASSTSTLDSLHKSDILELRNAAVSIEAVDLIDRWGWGTGFWDQLVFQYVPGQIVGFDVKKSLQFGNQQTIAQVRNYLGYRIPTGSTLTGIGDSYIEFGWLGCLVFAGMARIFKTLWASIYRGSMFSALLYIGLISPAMVGVTHGISRFLQEFVFQCGVMWLVVKYAGVSVRYQRESV